MEITLKNLTKVFTDSKGKETRAVDNPSTFKIPSGQTHWFAWTIQVWESLTTLYMISGLQNPTRRAKSFWRRRCYRTCS